MGTMARPPPDLIVGEAGQIEIHDPGLVRYPAANVMLIPPGVHRIPILYQFHNIAADGP